MALTSTTTTDLIGQTQILTYFNPSQVDQITFSSNSITFSAISSFNLIKSDILLYFKYLNTFNNLLLINFPSIVSSIGAIWPLCSFDIVEETLGITHLIYTQTSLGTQVFESNYVPLAGSASFAARGSPVTISLQEWFSFIVFTAQYSTQVNLN